MVAPSWRNFSLRRLARWRAQGRRRGEMALAQRQAVANVSNAASEEPPLITAAQDSTTAQPSTTAASQPKITVIAMGGTIDKDYPRSAGGYAFEIDEPAAGRVLSDLPPNVSVPHVIVSVCRKDSTEINAADRQALCDAVASVPPGGRVVVTHGTDTLVESAQALERSGAHPNLNPNPDPPPTPTPTPNPKSAQVLERSGAANGKAVVFTGAMRPERFRQSDAAFHLGGAVAA